MQKQERGRPKGVDPTDASDGGKISKPVRSKSQDVTRNTGKGRSRSESQVGNRSKSRERSKSRTRGISLSRKNNQKFSEFSKKFQFHDEIPEQGLAKEIIKVFIDYITQHKKTDKSVEDYLKSYLENETKNQDIQGTVNTLIRFINHEIDGKTFVTNLLEAHNALCEPGDQGDYNFFKVFILALKGKRQAGEEKTDTYIKIKEFLKNRVIEIIIKSKGDEYYNLFIVLLSCGNYGFPVASKTDISVSNLLKNHNTKMVQYLINQEGGNEISKINWKKTDKEGNTILHIMAEHSFSDDNSIETLARTIGVDVNKANKKKKTALHIAAEFNNAGITTNLLTVLANINQKDQDGCTPLYIAVEKSYVEVVKKLLEHNVNINLEGPEGLTPLHIAVKVNSEILTALLKHDGFGFNKAEISKTDQLGNNAFHHAAIHNMSENIKILSEHIKDNNKYLINEQNNSKKTPLLLASMDGHYEAVEQLLESGADHNLVGEKNNTPLHVAAMNGYTDIVEKLLKKGCDPNLVNTGGSPPLFLAIDKKEPKIIERLFKATNDPHKIKSREGENMLHFAVLSSYKEAVEQVWGLILNNDSKFNPEARKKILLATNNTGQNVFHMAVKNSDVKSLESLLRLAKEYLGDEEFLGLINAQDNEEKTPLDYTNSLESSHKELIDLLKKKGAKRSSDLTSQQAPIVSRTDDKTKINFGSVVGAIAGAMICIIFLFTIGLAIKVYKEFATLKGSVIVSITGVLCLVACSSLGFCIGNHFTKETAPEKAEISNEEDKPSSTLYIDHALSESTVSLTSPLSTAAEQQQKTSNMAVCGTPV